MGRALRIIVADADSKNAGLLAFGFEREGMAAVVAHAAADVGALVASGDVDAIVLSLGSTGLLTNAVSSLRATGGAQHLPILALGDPAARTQVLGAGASEFLARPAYVRDVVSLCRLLATARIAKPQAFTAELADFASLVFVIRALCETRRSGVIAVECAGRRAELRFCDGTVASAQLGKATGLDAVRRVALWQQGRLEIRLAAVPRSGEIGLELPALIEAQAQFLRAAYELAPEAAGNAYFEKDVRRVAEAGAGLSPTSATVLREHDGRLRLWEVIADTAGDGLETIAQTRRLVEQGLLMLGRGARSKVEPHAHLASSDWLIGAQQPVDVPSLVGYGDVHEPSNGGPRVRTTPVSPELLGIAQPREGGEVPTAPVLRPPGAGGFAPTVPSQVVTGEIGGRAAPVAKDSASDAATGPARPSAVRVAVAPPSVSVAMPGAIALPPPVLPGAAAASDEATDPEAPTADAARARSHDGTVSGQLTARPERPATQPPMATASIEVRNEEPAVVVDRAMRAPSQPPIAAVNAAVDAVIASERARRESQPPPASAPPVVVTPGQPSILTEPRSLAAERARRASSQPGLPIASQPDLPAMRPSQPGLAARPSQPELIAQVQRTAGDAARAAARALSFDALDEKFFKEGAELSKAKPPPLETFDDLEQGDKTEESPKPGFWKRLVTSDTPSGGGSGNGGKKR